MGTYRQPSQVIDKSFDTLNQGLENVNQKISDGLIFQRNQEIAKAKEAKKEQEKRNKELKDLRDRQQAAADGYQVEIDNFENINQPRTDSWEQEDVTVTNQIKNNSKYFLDIMSNNLPGTEEYRRAERALKNMIKQYPVMASLFNQESEQTDSAFVNGVQIGENEDGAILNSNDPLQSVKLHMLRDLKTGANPERFQVLSLPSGQVFKYEDADGKVFETAYQDYVDFRESGGNLIDTVNGEEYNTFMDGIWNKTLKKTYDTLSTKITSYREGIRNGDPVNFKDVEVSYTQANKNLDNTLDNWVDGGGSVSQSTWQMLGGSGVYNPEENKEQLKTYLKTKVKDRFTTQEDKYTLSEQEIIQGGGKSSSDSSGDNAINPEEKSYSDKFINNLKDLKEGKKGSEDPYIGTDLDGRNIRKIKKDGDSITFITQDLDSSGEPTGEPFNQTFNLNNKKQIENLERKLLKQTPKNYDVSVIETYINTKTDEFIVGEESFDIDPLISFQEFNKEETGVVSKLKDLYPNVTFEEAIPGTNAISVKVGDQDAKEFRLSNKDDYNKFIRLVDPKYDKGDPTKGMTNEEKIKYYLANSSK